METSQRQPRLSIVVPAFNEERRLPETLRRISRYLQDRDIASELIVVDDGSSDRTLEIARSFCGAKNGYRVIGIRHGGKAAAVRAGALASRGQYVLFTDADLSTPIDTTDSFVRALDSGADVVIGSREGKDARRIGEPAYRHLMGRVFNGLVRLIALPGIDDTQCGFKAFRRDVARDIFCRMRLHRSNKPVAGPRVTAFDVELLVIARQRGYRIVTMPVTWTHAPGSKVNPVVDSLRMLGDVIRVRFNAMQGRYN